MGLFGSLFTCRPASRRDPPVTTDDVSAVYIALRNRICDFKDVTNMSWALILPAIQRMSIRLFIQARGRESKLKLLECIISKMEEERGVHPHAVLNITYTQTCHLSNCASWRGFVALVGSRISRQFDESYASGLVHVSYREIQSGAFNDVGT
jgi:hypothetical protein